MAKFVATEWHR